EVGKVDAIVDQAARFDVPRESNTWYAVPYRQVGNGLRRGVTREQLLVRYDQPVDLPFHRRDHRVQIFAASHFKGLDLDIECLPCLRKDSHGPGRSKIVRVGEETDARQAGESGLQEVHALGGDLVGEER